MFVTGISENCSYQYLDSVLPPSPDEQICSKELKIRLEYLCAVSIAKQGSSNIISQTPAHLHKLLWSAYLTERYDSFVSSEYDPNEDRFSHLHKLLYNWPYEDFCLKDVMPSFTTKLEDFAAYRDPSAWPWDNHCETPYRNNRDSLESFYDMVQESVTETFTNESSDKFGKYDTFCKIRKIDISEYKVYPSILEKIEIKEPFLRNCYGKLEIILNKDITIDSELYKEIKAGVNSINESTYTNSFNSIVLKFNHLDIETIWGGDGKYMKTEAVTGFIGRLMTSGAVSIELSGEFNGAGVLEKVLKDKPPLEHFLQVSIRTYSTWSLTFLQHMSNLIHLELTDVKLHGKLNALRNMRRGLLYLNMQRCCLGNLCLVQLIGSCHQQTLRELNLRGNSFYLNKGTNNLTELCKNLPSILQLDVGDCAIGTWPTYEKDMLFSTFKSLPNIVCLNLSNDNYCIYERRSCNNKFSVYDINNYIMTLKESLTLKYLDLSFCLNPEEFTDITNAKLLCVKVNNMINENRSQVMIVDFKDYYHFNNVE